VSGSLLLFGVLGIAVLACLAATLILAVVTALEYVVSALARLWPGARNAVLDEPSAGQHQ
jgi:hypothetical protein